MKNWWTIHPEQGRESFETEMPRDIKFCKIDYELIPTWNFPFDRRLSWEWRIVSTEKPCGARISDLKIFRRKESSCRERTKKSRKRCGVNSKAPSETFEIPFLECRQSDALLTTSNLFLITKTFQASSNEQRRIRRVPCWRVPYIRESRIRENLGPYFRDFSGLRLY